ncbi:MAG: IS30 family transposase [Acidovorax sp.]|uniref:IS30 family transposase n=1 Tax=Acidovorax sp. TaxID=1872122 RepID=UPI0039E51BED
MSYTHLSQSERYQIQCLHDMGLPLTRIAHQLGRHRGTIAREIKRSGCTGAYRAEVAQQQANARQQNSKRNAQRFFEQHWTLVRSYLQLELSPQQVSARLALEKRLHISHACIYNHIRCMGGAMPPLRCGQRRRRKAHSGAGQLTDRLGIAQRPAIVERRSRLGDWEGDTIASGSGGLAGLVTLTERRSRYTLAQHVQRRQAQPVAEAIIEMLRPHERCRHTLTLDNGKEFAQHAWVCKRLNTKVYFADPHSPWQRGLNENHNGLLRHYFPKGSDLGQVTEQQVLDAVYQLNHRPRKCLGWKTPHEVFHGYRIAPLTLPGWRTS